MNNLVKGGVVAGTLMVGAAALVIGAGVAKADSTDFINDAHAHGITNLYGDWALLRDGTWMCEQLDAGMTESYVGLQYHAMNPLMLGGSTGTMISLAEWDLCPYHKDQDWYQGKPSFLA